MRVGVVGSGYRAGLLLDVARRVPEHLAVVGVVARSVRRREEVAARWGVPALATTAELADREPELVVTAVAADANPDLVEDLVTRGLPVLSETPPAPDVEGLRRLWGRVGASGLVQVAEQYHRQPMNAARSAVVRAGLLGRVTSAHVSMTQLYHAVSLLRGALGARFDPAEVRASSAVSPLADPLSRAGWADPVPVRSLTTTLATVHFGASGTGLYDFTETQTRNPLRATRVVLRGERGELVDERVVRLLGPATVVESQLRRRQTGGHRDNEVLDLDHISLDGDVLYRNPFPGARLSDEEVSIASLLVATGVWARGEGPAPYPLAEACQDHLVGLAVVEAARWGRPVTTGVEAWAEPVPA